MEDLLVKKLPNILLDLNFRSTFSAIRHLVHSCSSILYSIMTFYTHKSPVVLALTDFAIPLLMVTKPRADITGRFMDMVCRNFLTYNEVYKLQSGVTAIS